MLIMGVLTGTKGNVFLWRLQRQLLGSLYSYHEEVVEGSNQILTYRLDGRADQQTIPLSFC